MSLTLEKITALEAAALQLEPGVRDRQNYLEVTHQVAEEFLEAMASNGKAYISDEGDGSALTNSPFEESGAEIQQLWDLYDAQVNHPGINPASGGHLGYIPGGGVYTAALGDFMAAVTNRYAGIFYGNPGAVRMENMLLRWCADLIGYPASAAGVLLSGGSIANLTCIVTAREAKGLKCANIPKSVIYLTEQVHHCVTKALRIAGLSEAQLRFVPMDEGYRMDTAALRSLLKTDLEQGLSPFLVVASAGTTDAGAVDPIPEIAALRDEYGFWLHLDAAYGGFFALCEEGRRLLPGMDLSDSIVMDPHKGMFLPYGLGLALVKEGRHLAAAHQFSANYMQDADSGGIDPMEMSPAELGPELTKHFRGLRMWLPMKLHGLGAFRACVEEKLWLARYFWEGLPALPHVERGPWPDLSVVLYRFCPPNWEPNDFNQRLMAACHRDGRVFLSSTTIEGQVYLRLACLSFRTHRDTIDLCFAMLKENLDLVLGLKN